MLGGGACCVCAMRLISWNVRGLGGLEKRREVRKLVGEKSPLILCLQETKVSVCDVSLCNFCGEIRVMHSLLDRLWGHQGVC